MSVVRPHGSGHKSCTAPDKRTLVSTAIPSDIDVVDSPARLEQRTAAKYVVDIDKAIVYSSAEWTVLVQCLPVPIHSSSIPVTRNTMKDHWPTERLSICFSLLFAELENLCLRLHRLHYRRTPNISYLCRDGRIRIDEYSVGCNGRVESGFVKTTYDNTVHGLCCKI